jgi:pimeloyl-ACP methyl ester carboxylesterase
MFEIYPIWATVSLLVAPPTFLLIALHLWSRPRATDYVLTQEGGHTRLVVLVHGLAGRRSFEPAVELARAALPSSDLLVFDYDSRALSNASPYAIANTIERRIHDTHTANEYQEIVLVGHSLGGMLLRKALVWGGGFEEDREDHGLRGAREWPHRVSRFVSLASINRGWSIAPRPSNMGVLTYFLFVVGARLARLSRSGGLLLGLQRGAPFVADLRVQWIALCRGDEPTRVIPQTIHFLGDRDDIVSRDDSMDLIAAKDTIFVTLQNTSHRDIATALGGGETPADRERQEKVGFALQGLLDRLDPDLTIDREENESVERIVYIMHGIRDYGLWTDKLRTVIEAEAAARGQNIEVVNQKYGRFPMGPFLLYWDRQKKVRLFMDEYTENRARFPRAGTFDYIGHSNGSYILASALLKYKTLVVRRVCFAGSVVPKHYPWRKLADRERVSHVVNILAAGDWVVALFPRFFEQIAEWLNMRPLTGLLDIGSAGFRGFEEAMDAQGRIENVCFADGEHGAAVDAADDGKMQAIARYIVSDDKTGLDVFRRLREPKGWLSSFSNLSWLVWALILGALSGIEALAFLVSPWAGWGVAVLILALLCSI